MQFILVGINYQKTPITVLEKVAISAEKMGNSLTLFRSYVPNGVILSTCNRTEIYTVNSNGYDAEKASLAFLKDGLEVSDRDLLQNVYVAKDRAATEHLFRVASGLESMVVGEYEVLGQVRQTLDVAERQGLVNLPLRHAFQSAIRTGRLVRAQTAISRNALSVSSVAVDLAADIIGDIKRCTMLVIGVGEAGKLVAEVALKRGVSRMVIASRTKKRAQALAATLHGIPIALSHLSEELHAADIVITCTGASHRVLDVPLVAEAMQKRSGLPMMIVDIGLPRNVDPEVGQIKNVFLYNIYDLTEISNLNRKQREGEVSRAEEIIAKEVDKFERWWQDFEVRPVVSALMTRAEEIRLAKLNKTLKKLPSMSDEQRENLEAMTKSIVTMILKDPIKYLKANGNGKHAEMIRELFQLKIDERL